MPIATAGLPLKRASMSWFWAPSSTRATSLIRNSEPSGLARNTMLPNCSGVVSRPLRLDVQLELLLVRDRPRADAADRRHHVLRLDRGDHIGRGQLQVVETLGVEPDPHRVIERAKDMRLSDPRRARQHVEHIDDRVIGDEQRVLFAGLAVEHDELQDRRRFLLDRPALRAGLPGAAGTARSGPGC